MTQSSLQTQCPHCQTRFRVTDQQLGMAKGKVRCGSCMEVFNALEHQIQPGSTGQSAAPAARPTPPAAEPRKAPRDRDDDDELIFADNPEEDATEGPYAGTRLTFSDDELSDSFRDIDESAPADFREPEDEPGAEEVDESWAEAMLEEPASRSGSTPYSRPESSAGEPARRPERDAPPPRRAAPPAQSLAPESEPESEPERPLQSATKPEPPHPGVGGGTELSLEGDLPEDDTRSFRVEPEHDRVGDPVRARAPFSDLKREPVAVSGSSRGKRALLWTAILLVLAGLLVAQAAWFQFDRLSAIPALRPYYERACELAGCTLDPLVDVSAIQSRKLVVRTDPENRSQLVVDAVLLNRADFEQPFPAIALTFSNLNGDVVAQSLFTPEEYLAGDARDLKSLPVDTPVHIAIHIRDPGRDAVNYNLEFRRYTP